MVLSETLDGVEGGLSQSGFVRTAGRCGDQIDVGFACQIAFDAPAQCPGGAGAGRKILVTGGGIFLGGENWSGEFAVDLFGQILLHAVGETPGFCFTVFDGERNFEAGKEHRLAAQQALQFAERNVGRVEKLGVRPDAKARAAGPLGGVAGPLQRFDDATAGKDDAMPAAVAHDLDLETRR